MAAPLWIWVLFIVGICVVLVVDLLVVHRRAHEITATEAGIWTAAWIGLALAFALVVWVWQGSGAAAEYLTGYVVERSLSIDNVFVLAVIFSYFGVPAAFRYRALLCGVAGALVLRAGFIAGGAVALERVAWSVYVFGGFLLLTGARLALRDIDPHPETNLVLRAFRRLVPMTHELDEQRFVVRRAGRRMATPMVAVLVAIATTDVAFAADSVPAIFAVTDDTFLVFAANAFSVLGMLALYFLLADAVTRFAYLRHALAAVLVFVGAKMLTGSVYDIPPLASLAVVLFIVLVGIGISVVHPPAEDAGEGGVPGPFPLVYGGDLR